MSWLEAATMTQSSAQEEVIQARCKYREQAIAWLRGTAEAASLTPVTTIRKRYRKSAYEWLVLTDGNLRRCTGLEGFDSYRIDPEKQLDPAKWPLLRIGLDQGSDGWSAAHFLLASNCNVELHPDLSHGANNDLKGVAKDLQLWQHELLMAIPYNFRQAPWGSGIRHHQLREIMLSHLDTINPHDDPLFQSMLPDILEDLGLDEDIVADDIIESVWERVKSEDCIFKRGPALSFSKYMGAQITQRSFLSRWSITLFQLLVWGMHSNHLEANKFAELMSKKMMLYWKRIVPEGADADEAKVSQHGLFKIYV